MAREFQALGFTAGQGVDGLAQAQIAQTDIGQRSQGGHNFGLIIKKFQGLANRQIENIVDILTLIGDLQNRFFEAPALAVGAGDEHIRQKLHLDLFEAIAFAGLTASAIDVKRKIARPEALGPGRIGGGQQFADGVKSLGVGQRIGPRGAADGALVDQNHIIDVADSGNFLMPAGSVLGIAQGALGGFVEDFLGQGGFAGSGYAGQADKQPQGYVNIDVF